MPSLSVVVITKNEAQRIERCLQSVHWAEEKVVLDSDSEDDTVARARACGARVQVRADWPGFGVQKNRALELATGDWILVLDADEFVSPALAREIRGAITGPPRCYGLRRRSTFLGRAVRWGDWRDDVVWRLFPRGAARFDDAPVHENLQCGLPRAVLQGDLHHETYVTWGDVRRKSDWYAALGAAKLQRRGVRAHALAPWLHGAWAWLRCFVLRLGFLDGRAGAGVAAMQARVAFEKYRRLRQLPAAGAAPTTSRQDGADLQ